MAITYDMRRTTADAVFAVEDAHARRRLAGALHPAPLGRVVFRVVGPRVGGVLRPFAEPTTMVLVQTDSGFSVFARDVTLEMEDGGRVRRRLRDGTYVVRVESDAYQRPADFDLTLPNPAPAVPRRIDLEPGYAYPFRNGSPLRGVIAPAACTKALQREGRGPTLLRGGLHGPDGSGIAGATIAVDGLPTPTYTTDETGQWVLPFLDAHPTGPVTVRATPPGAPAIVVPGVCVVKGRETSVRIP